MKVKNKTQIRYILHKKKNANILYRIKIEWSELKRLLHTIGGSSLFQFKTLYFRPSALSCQTGIRPLIYCLLTAGTSRDTKLRPVFNHCLFFVQKSKSDCWTVFLILTWKSCLCMTWWWDVLLEGLRPTSERDLWSSQAAYPPLIQSLSVGGCETSSPTVCCCALWKIQKVFECIIYSKKYT